MGTGEAICYYQIGGHHLSIAIAVTRHESKSADRKDCLIDSSASASAFAYRLPMEPGIERKYVVRGIRKSPGTQAAR